VAINLRQTTIDCVLRATGLKGRRRLEGIFCAIKSRARLPHFVVDDMNIPLADSIRTQSLQTYTVVDGKTHEPGNAERLRGKKRRAPSNHFSFVGFLYADVKRDE
jgi:hypothetical protein